MSAVSVPCPRCGGLGTIDFIACIIGVGGQPEMGQRCGLCHGTGKASWADAPKQPDSEPEAS